MPLAVAMDGLLDSEHHARVIAQARERLQAPDTLPSARVLAAVRRDHADSFVAFARAQSQRIRDELLALPWSAAQQARFEAMSAASVAEQQRIEAADTMPFEIYRQEYVSAARLGKPLEAVPA